MKEQVRRLVLLGLSLLPIAAIAFAAKAALSVAQINKHGVRDAELIAGTEGSYGKGG